MFKALLLDVPRIVGELILKIPEIIAGITSEFLLHKDDFSQMGLDMIHGMWEGIQNSAQWLKDKISGFFDGVVDNIKSFFGIASPSKLMKKEIGLNMALGVGEGFVDEMDKVSKDMQNAIPTEFDTSLSTNVDYAGYQPFSYSDASSAYNSAAYASAGGGTNTGTGKQPILVVVQIDGGIELGRKLIEIEDEARRADGLAY